MPNKADTTHLQSRMQMLPCYIKACGWNPSHFLFYLQNSSLKAFLNLSNCHYNTWARFVAVWFTRCIDRNKERNSWPKHFAFKNDPCGAMRNANFNKNLALLKSLRLLLSEELYINDKHSLTLLLEITYWACNLQIKWLVICYQTTTDSTVFN